MLSIIREEFLAIQSALNAIHEVPPGTGYYTPDPATCNVVAWQAGDRGNTPAGFAARDLLEDFRPEVLVVVGIAGGIAGREDIEPGDVLIADYVHYSEYTKVVPGAPLRRYATYDQPSVSLRQRHADPVINRNAWQDTITVDRPRPGRSKAVVGAIVAGEKVLGDPRAEAQRYVAKTFDNAVGVDMESFGVGRAVHDVRREVDYNPRLLIVRGISDTVEIDDADGEAHADEQAGADQADNNAQRREWKEYAAASAAAFAKEVVDRLCESDDVRKVERASE